MRMGLPSIRSLLVFQAIAHAFGKEIGHNLKVQPAQVNKVKTGYSTQGQRGNPRYPVPFQGEREKARRVAARG